MAHALCLTLALAQTAPAPTDPLSLSSGGGRTDYTIIVRKDATPTERHAAEELSYFLQEITAAPFPVRSVESAPQAPAACIRVGAGAAAGIIPAAELDRLGQEGYVLRTHGATLAIAGGRPRGTLYGVYSFLEDVLDCRWFTPDVARIPKRSRLEVRPLDRTFVPRLESRATDYPNSRDADWAARNKLNGTQAHLDARRGGKVAYGPFVHTFDAILNPKDHFRQHPEYFSEVDGKRLGERTQLCVTNPDVLHIAIEIVRRWMREQPGATIFSVSQNDWYNYCTCPACARVIQEEGAPSGAYLRFVNAIADAVRAEFPDKAIDTLAYQFTRKPPARAVPRPNVIIRLCDIECCFAHPLHVRADIDRRNADFADDLRRWSAIADRLYVWDYVVNFRHSITPLPNLYVLKPNIQYFVDHHVRGVYEEADYFSKGGEFAELRTWVVAKTLWDPHYDTDRAIDEFLDGYYEAAAAPLRRYIDLLHGKARMDEIHVRIFDRPNSPLFADDVLTRADALFDDAEKRVAEKPAVLHRVRVARLPIQYVRIAHLLDRISKSESRTARDVEQLWAIFERFDAVARKEGVSRVSERRSYDDWAAEVRRALATPAR
jgi:hypothetical protein